MVENGKTVKVHYKGTLQDGSVFDSSEGGDPIEFEVGTQTVIPGFEAAIVTMDPGDTQTITIPSAEAYGDRSEDMVGQVPRDNLPDDMEPELGMMLQVQTPDGNHPLAGEDLTFELKLVEVV